MLAPNGDADSRGRMVTNQIETERFRRCTIMTLGTTSYCRVIPMPHGPATSSGSMSIRTTRRQGMAGEPCFSIPFFLIRIVFEVARHVAGVHHSQDMFHDSDLIPEEIC